MRAEGAHPQMSEHLPEIARGGVAVAANGHGPWTANGLGLIRNLWSERRSATVVTGDGAMRELGHGKTIAPTAAPDHGAWAGRS